MPSSQRDLCFLSVTLTEKKDKISIQLTHFTPIKAHSCFTLISFLSYSWYLTRKEIYAFLINKTNDLILNLTPENVTQHSRIE